VHEMERRHALLDFRLAKDAFPRGFAAAVLKQFVRGFEQFGGMIGIALRTRSADPVMVDLVTGEPDVIFVWRSRHVWTNETRLGNAHHGFSTLRQPTMPRILVPEPGERCVDVCFESVQAGAAFGG
jgi:hypothetical protein